MALVEGPADKLLGVPLGLGAWQAAVEFHERRALLKGLAPWLGPPSNGRRQPDHAGPSVARDSDPGLGKQVARALQRQAPGHDGTCLKA